MQITYSGNQNFKIRGKKAFLLIEGGKISLFKNKEDKPFVIEAPGEYEIAEVSVFGIKDVYVIGVDGTRVCYLKREAAELNAEQLEEADGVDILLLAVRDAFKSSRTAKLIKEIQPKILVLNSGPAGERLLKELGYEQTKKETRLSVSQNDLPEEMEIVSLKAK